MKSRFQPVAHKIESMTLPTKWLSTQVRVSLKLAMQLRRQRGNSETLPINMHELQQGERQV